MPFALLYQIALIFLLRVAYAATVTYDFNVGWVSANPDGAFERPVMGVNGKWPIPEIRASVGDQLVIKVHNMLGNQSTSIHFHGLYQNGTPEMDGAVGVTQCAIAPGSSFTYNLTVIQRMPSNSSSFSC